MWLLAVILDSKDTELFHHGRKAIAQCCSRIRKTRFSRASEGICTTLHQSINLLQKSWTAPVASHAHQPHAAPSLAPGHGVKQSNWVPWLSLWLTSFFFFFCHARKVPIINFSVQNFIPFLVPPSAALRIEENQRKGGLWEFPDGPVVRTLCFQCRGCRFNPWSEN